MKLTKKDVVPRPRTEGRSIMRHRLREFATELKAKQFADKLRLKGLSSIIHHPATSVKRKWAVDWSR